MQEILLDNLRTLGFVQNDTPLARLQLYRAEQHVAVEATADRLRFYAPPPGDRWNASDIYWLALGSSVGLRMTSRPTLGDDAAALPITETGWESGRWSAPALYDSTLPGADGDHWFAADMRSGPEMATTTLTVPVPSVLPPLTASAVFTLHTTGYTKHAHNVRVSAAQPTPTATLLSWAGSGDRARPRSTWTAAPNNSSLPPRGGRRQTACSSTISFCGSNRGPAFRLHLRRIRERQPRRPSTSATGGRRRPPLRHQRSPAACARAAGRPHRGHNPGGKQGNQRFLLVVDGARRTLSAPHLWQRPQPQQRHSRTRAAEDRGIVTAFTPAPRNGQRPRLRLAPALNFAPARNVDALYVAPAIFHPALQPLLEHRSGQGYRVALVDLATKCPRLE